VLLGQVEPDRPDFLEVGTNRVGTVVEVHRDGHPERGDPVEGVVDESPIPYGAEGLRHQVAQGREALELLTQGRRFDAVLTDVMMPGVQGDAIARRLGAEQPHAAVVLMSGMLPGPGPRAAVERNGAHFLAKPFTPAALLATLDAALAGRAKAAREASG